MILVQEKEHHILLLQTWYSLIRSSKKRDRDWDKTIQTEREHYTPPPNNESLVAMRL